VAGLVAAACLLASAGCGARAHQGGARQADREWVDNTSGVIDQLQRDLVLGSAAGDSLAAARKALRSGLYTLLVAYTDFGGCRHMVAALGRAPARLRSVGLQLDRACASLQRSSALFTEAVADHDPRTLTAAVRFAQRATQPLLRGELALGP
jgi:hypothetical protein